MPNYCDCGTALVDDAQFCHHCGKPQTEEALAEQQKREPPATPEPLPDTLEPPAAEAEPIGFGNRTALRSCYWPGAVAALLGNLPLLNWLCFLWYPAAGFYSVYSYRRRTGQDGRISEGTRLGLLTGALCAVITLILNTIGFLFAAEELPEAFREQIQQVPGQDQVKEMLLGLLDDPAALVLIFLASLILSVILIIGFCSLGGALGAKVLEEDR